jgi:hypothetical protein
MVLLFLEREEVVGSLDDEEAFEEGKRLRACVEDGPVDEVKKPLRPIGGDGRGILGR